MTRGVTLEVNITYACNAVCQDCNRAVGVSRFPNTEMTAEQMGRAVDTMNDQGFKVRKMSIIGGEPIVNRELPAILDHAVRSKGLTCGRLLTNNIPGKRTGRHPEGEAKAKRDAMKLPSPFKWIRSGLDDPENPLSGKTKHDPFFWSPKDFGLTSLFGECRVKNFCGKGLDANGWSMCGIAGVLGRLLRINPYTLKGGTVKETPGICEHCPYGLPRATQQGINAEIEAGKKPRFSPTLQKGVEDNANKPLKFERL